MQTLTLDEFLEDRSEAAKLRDVARQIDAADVAISAAFRERDARFFPAVLSGALIVAVVANEMLGDRSLLRELRGLVGSLGIMAIVLAGLVFPGRWVQANWRYDQTITNSHALNLAHFKPLGAWYGGGSVSVRPLTPEERKARLERARESISIVRAALDRRNQSVNGKTETPDKIA